MKSIAILGLWVALGAFGCTVSAPEQDEQDATQKNIPLCGAGALASEALQPGAKGGPDARTKVSCSSGYALCRIDPKGPDNDVCTSATNCYACTHTVTPVKIDQQLVCAAVAAYYDVSGNQTEQSLKKIPQSQLAGDALSDFKLFQKNMLPDYPSQAYAITLKRAKQSAVSAILIEENNDGGGAGGVYLASSGKRIAQGYYSESENFSWDTPLADKCPAPNF